MPLIAPMAPVALMATELYSGLVTEWLDRTDPILPPRHPFVPFY